MVFTDFLTQKGYTQEKFDALDVNDQAAIFNEYNAAEKTRLEDAIENKASKEDISKLEKSIADNYAKQFEALNKAVASIGAKLVKTERTSKATVKDQIREALEANKSVLSKMKESESGRVTFTVKAAGSMTLAGNVSGGNVPVEDRLEGFNAVPVRPISLLDVMSRRSTTSNVVSWVYQANKDGAAGQTAEAGTKNLIDFDLVVASENIKKTTARIKVSTEMLDDVEFIESEINNELQKELLKAVEAGAYNGNGTGNNLNGVYTVATEFTGAGMTAEQANIVDVLVAAITQIEEADQMTPNFAFLSPRVVNQLLMEKVSSTDGRYIDRLQLVGGQLSIDGMTKIVKTNLVGNDEFLIGDFNKAILVERDGVKIDIGLSGTDFEENMRTILAEWRGACVVKNNDRTAFVKGTIAAAKAIIERT